MTDNAHGGDDTLVGGAVSGTSGANMLEGDEGNDLLIGTGGYTVARYRGSFSEYSFTRNADGTFTIADSQAGRDGTDTLKDISALEFADISQVPVNASLPNYGYSMPVSDRVEVSGPGPYVIVSADLLANDKNYAGLSLSIRELLDVNGNTIARGASGAVIGGVAALSADGATITFTPTAGFTGVMKFKYHVSDSAGKTGAIVQQVGTTNTAEVTDTVYLHTPDLPSEELFDQQWYLPETNVLPVWKDYTGKGVKVVVFDPSGNVDLTHPDIAVNAGDSVKINGNPGVEKYGAHATLVAGVIGAARDGEGVVGVAYDAQISSVALPTDASTNLNNLRLWKNYDVVNNSWGFDPAFVDSFLTNSAYETAYYDAVAQGRGGKGTILVFAAGNDRTTRNTNDLNETNSLYGITVAGINAKTDLSSLTIGPSPFSTRGETILVSAPGSNIVSTNELMTSSTGTVFGSDYATAEGTSFATPIVSGVVALMLEANPGLGYRDVQDILAYSARNVNDPATTWQINLAKDWNGGGLHYSRDYGFGEVDARAAVRLAETWQGQKTIANMATTNWVTSQTATVGNGAHVVIDSSGAHFTYANVFPVSYAASVSGMSVEHVQVHVDLDVDAHALNDIKVILEPIHPSVSTLNWYGTIYTLTNYNYVDSQASILLDGEQSVPLDASYVIAADGHRHLQFVYGSVKYRGEDPGSDLWALRIIQNSTGQEVTPSSNWSIRFIGSSASEPQQWIFTDEYGGGASITPATSGDSFNAAAATGNNVIDLRAGTSDSRVDGKAITVNGDLANGFGGDGNDTLYGTASANILEGGRGDDLIQGGLGADTFVFHPSFGHDTIVDLQSSDVIQFDQEIFGDWAHLQSAMSQSGADTIITVDPANVITLKDVDLSSLEQNMFRFGPLPPSRQSPYISLGSGPDALVLRISEDAWQGDAQYTISVDGNQIGDALTASSSHSDGQFDTIAVFGNWSPGSHAVSVNFLNDAYGGSPSTDSNLYIDGATYDGVAVSGAPHTFFEAGSAGFSVSDTTKTIGSGPDSLVLRISEDAWQGDAQYRISVDGNQIGDMLTAWSSHAAGLSDTITVLGDWGAGNHAVSVDFLNDAYLNSPETDRNLYVDSATYNGVAISNAQLTLYVGGPASFSFNALS
jgi:subtilisin family serine protease